MKRYDGTRVGPGDVTVLVTGPEGVSRLRHREKHSPDGFEWGYGGSGPSDLARSILWDVLGEEPPARMYHDFKFEIVASWRSDEWTASEGAIRRWVEAWKEKHDG